MTIHGKYYNKNTQIDELLDDGYTGLQALQILDMIENNDTIDDLASSSPWLYPVNEQIGDQYVSY